MLARVARPEGPLTEDVLHQYRVLGKRARYAAEFAPKSPRTAQFITQLKRLQDAIGNWHDWLTLTHTAVGRLGEIRESSLVAVLHNVTGAKFRSAVAALSTSPVLRTSPKPVVAQASHSRKSGAKTPEFEARTNSAA